jgi:hypothetical protein
LELAEKDNLVLTSHDAHTRTLKLWSSNLKSCRVEIHQKTKKTRTNKQKFQVPGL